jgi:hypothetical protein
MNCLNHPDIAVSAYCQNCGKPLCDQCVRQVAGVIYCEPCLAAKVGAPGASKGSYTVGVGDSGQFQYTATGPLPPNGPGPNPGLATILGFIPGVGAMYNGQYIKALVHVLVFVVLIGITDEHGIFGLFIAAWVLYQVFDAQQTAKARRDGLPLPDPFGLNELGNRLGIQNAPVPHPYTPPPSNQVPPPSSYMGAVPQSPPAAEPFAPNPEYVPFTPVSGPPPYPPGGHRRAEPIGAIVLIGLGLLFLFGTLGIFHFDWIGRGWPVIIIIVGVWMFLKRTRETPQGGGQ